MPMIIEPQP